MDKSKLFLFCGVQWDGKTSTFAMLRQKVESGVEINELDPSPQKARPNSRKGYRNFEKQYW